MLLPCGLSAAAMTPATARAPPPRMETARARSSAAHAWSPADWQRALADQLREQAVPVSLRVSGSLPDGLEGVLYKVGPARFGRDQRYAHWLEGDGAVVRLEIRDGSAHVTSRFVQTAEWKAEEAAGRVLTRGAFGTRRAGGAWANAFDLRLKNPANTHVVAWGTGHAQRVLAFAEVGLPHALDPSTLATVGVETFGGRLRSGLAAATTGWRLVDDMVRLGDAVSAHYRVMPEPEAADEAAPARLVAWSMRQDVSKGDVVVRLLEVDSEWRYVADTSEARLPRCGFPPHDFGCSAAHALWITSPAKGNMLPYLVGRKGPAQCIAFDGAGPSMMHLLPRATGRRRAPSLRSLELPAAYHPVHFANAWEGPPDCAVAREGVADAAGAGTPAQGQWVHALACAWTPESIAAMVAADEKMLGSWADVARGDFSACSPQRLVRFSANLRTSEVRCEYACETLSHVDFVKVHPARAGRWARYVWASTAAPLRPSADAHAADGPWHFDAEEPVAPPQSFCRIDMRTGAVVDLWDAGARRFVDDFVLAQRTPLAAEERMPSETVQAGDEVAGLAAGASEAAELRVWLIAPVFDAATCRSTFVVLDGSRLAAGPVCELHLDTHVPWGLHGHWVPHVQAHDR